MFMIGVVVVFPPTKKEEVKKEMVVVYKRKKVEKTKKKPTPPTKVRKSQGAKAIETKQNPSKPSNYEDIDVSGFNLFG